MMICDRCGNLAQEVAIVQVYREHRQHQDNHPHNFRRDLCDGCLSILCSTIDCILSRDFANPPIRLQEKQP